jgi:prepilin-type processing-associated H-X9-DG protein
MEQQAKHDMPKDGKPNEHTDPQLEGARRMLLDPIDILYCPTRRSGKFANTGKIVKFATNSAINPASERGQVARGDYAANAGDVSIGGGEGGPGSLGSALSGSYNWLSANETGLITKTENPDGTKMLTGISFQRSKISVQHVSDGTSHTYFAGEKYLNPIDYETGNDTGDNETWCTGHNNDNFRTTFYPPLQDTPGLENGNIFGSAHPTTFQVAWCDGHVEAISFDIDPTVHKNNGNRQDGNATQ